MAKTSRVAAAESPDKSPVPAPALSVPEPVSSAPVPAAEPSILDQFELAFAEAAAVELDATAPRKPAAPAPKPMEPPPLPKEPVAEPPAPAPAESPESLPAPQPQTPQTPQTPQPQPPSQPPPQLQPQSPPQSQLRVQTAEPPLFNEEEATQLQTFYTDWPDVARATETMIRGMLTQTARRMYQDMASSLAPYIHTIDTLADRQQLTELQGQVSDYDTVSGQLSSWAARQPAYLRTAYEHVIKAGTAAEVVDLINRYKSDMQSTTPAQAAQPTPAAPVAASAPASVPVNPALAAAAARLAPVATKRTNVVAPPADFDTAFAEFARAS